jgi:heptosyltransferase III
MKKIEPKKILIMKFRNIGDVLLTTPLIKNLKLNYPEATIDIAVNKGTEEMVSLNPNLNEVIVYDRGGIKKLSLFKRLWSEIRFALDIRKNKYDLVINTTKGDRGAQLALISGAKLKIGYQSGKNFLTKDVFDIKLPSQGLRHTLEMDLDSLRELQLPIKEKKVKIFWNKEDEQIVEQLLKENQIESKKFIHIHPVSRWMFKCINDLTMAEIIDYCENDLKLKVVLTAAPLKEEFEKLDSILQHCNSEPINLAGKLSLKQTAALNQQAKIFIGVDTAIMHISAANNIPVLAFFGPSGADHWGPWDNDLMESGYITRRGFRTMGKHRVVQENIECVPCGKDGCAGTKISECLMQLDIPFIKKNINEMVND